MLTRRVLMAGAGAALLAGAGRGAGPDRSGSSAGFPAGGGIDISARLLVDPFKDALGQPVIVENRIGAAGMIAANAVAKAPPDGRMMLVSTSGEIAISQHLYKEKMTYDPMRELAPITLIGIVPNVVVVDAATPVHNAAGAGRLRQGQRRQAVVLVVRRRQSAAACRRADEHDGRHQRAARAVPGRGAVGDRRRDRRL